MPRITNTNKILRENSDSISWNLEVLADYLPLTPIEKSHVTKRIPIAGTCYYSDNTWDFNIFNKENKPKDTYIIKFEGIPSNFLIYAKDYALRQLALKRNRVVTVREKINILKSFTNFLDKNNITYMEDITVSLLIAFFDTTPTKEKRVSKKKGIIKGFLEIIAKDSSVNFDNIYRYLSKINKAKEKQEREQGKHKLIPYKSTNSEISPFDNIISLAIQDLLNVNLSVKRRATACMIVILSETGMRVGEFRILQEDKLEEIHRPPLMNNSLNEEISSTKVYILHFYTYKTTISDGKWTHTFMTPNAVLAYNTLKEIMSFRRNKANKANSPCLLLNQFNNIYSSTSALWDLNREFYFYHENDLNIASKSPEIYNKFNIWTITPNDVKSSKNTFYPAGKQIYYITPHQYRVTCATILYCREHKHIEWIRRHMNHLSTEMTEHYIRDELEKRQKIGIAKALLSRSNINGTQLETDTNKISDDNIKNDLENEKVRKAYDDINKFLKKVTSGHKKLNIKNNIDEIVELLYEYELPLSDITLGYCMLDTLEVMCETQERLNMFEDFDIQIPTIDNLHISYSRFLDKAKVIEYNKKLCQSNDDYIDSYNRELDSMLLLLNRRLLPELNMLSEELQKKNIEEIKNKYDKLSSIINNFNEIKEEVLEWNQKIQNIQILN